MTTTEVETEERKVVGMPLVGDQIERFLREKRRRNLVADAEAARQIMFERIEQIEREGADKAA